MRLKIPRALLILSLSSVGLSGCEPKVVPFRLKVITPACTAPAPLEGATHLRFRVSGEGLEAPLLQVTKIAGESSQEIPDVPAGKNRTVEVRAYAGDPNAGGKVVALGSTLPFDVPDVVPQDRAPDELKVFLRRVNTFTPPSLEGSPTTCQQMLDARAGHTATLLQDGRVFIAGGYQLAGNPARRETLGKAEMFNPAIGGFEKAADMGLSSPQGLFSPTPRAHQGAVLLRNGQVLLAGGEQISNGSYFPVKAALVWDPTVNDYGGFDLKVARIRPGVATDKDGRVLIVGGADATGQPVENPEWYDPARGFQRYDANQPELENPKLLDTVFAPRIGMSVAPVQDGAVIAVAGGSNGSALSSEILFFEFDGQTFNALPSNVRLNTVRYAAGIANFQDPNKLMIVGGYASATEPQSGIGTSEIIATKDAFGVRDGGTLTEARGDACVASLKDGRVLVVGGRVSSATQSMSSRAVELIRAAESGDVPSVLAMPELVVGRYQHTCTTLHDGSVLVLGGVEDRAGGGRVLQDAWIFTPAPLD